MADVTTIGTVYSVSSATAGQIKNLAGVIFSYSDTTLTTRSIILKLGEYVILNYDSAILSTTGITPLTTIYAKGLTDANSSNIITAADIKRQLQINNCCASKKGAEYIEKFEKNIPCDELKDEAELMVGLIDSITGFVPKGELITGKQATYLLIVTGVGNLALNMDVQLTIGTASYLVSIGITPTRTTTIAATKIASAINSFYPQNYPFYAESSGANVIISGSTFNSANNTAVTLVSVLNGTITVAAPNVLTGGVASTSQGTNGITNEEVQKILDKINKLCHTPCLEVVDFDGE